MKQLIITNDGKGELDIKNQGFFQYEIIGIAEVLKKKALETIDFTDPVETDLEKEVD